MTQESSHKLEELEHRISAVTRTRCYFSVYDKLGYINMTKIASTVRFDISLLLYEQIFEAIPKTRILTFELL